MNTKTFKQFVKKNLPIIIAGISGATVGALIVYNKTAVFVPKNVSLSDGADILINQVTGRVVEVVPFVK